jgi:hypothetical protein
MMVGLRALVLVAAVLYGVAFLSREAGSLASKGAQGSNYTHLQKG